MPRIVPLQLLKCLRVLLDENGGILGPNEVPRIAGLLTKYSKKLVSKCIYVQILKSTKTELLDEFMNVGGWSLTYTWLNDSIRAMNWPLVQEILELLLLSPVDVIRLKINSAPKLVKGLCKDGGNEGVRILAKRLVEQWLKIVTEQSGASLSHTTPPLSTPTTTTTVAIKSSQTVPSSPSPMTESEKNHPVAQNNSTKDDSEQHRSREIDTVTDNSHNTLNYTITSGQRKSNNKSGLVFKFVVNDGQQTLKQVDKQVTDNKNISNLIEDNVLRSGSNIFVNDAADIQTVELKGKGEGKNSRSIEENVDKKHKSSRSKDRKSDKEREKDKRSSSHRSSSSSSSKSYSSSKSSNSSKNTASNDKNRDREKDRQHSSSKDKERKESGSSTSSSSSSSKHKVKQSSSSSKERNGEKDREKSQTSSTSSSSNKKSKEQDKDNKLMPPPPVVEKKSKEDVDLQKPKSITISNRKSSISIEVRRETDKHTKTVKTFNSQFRSHGLTEEAPRPPSRKDLKKSSTTSTSSVILPSASIKRSSPPLKESQPEKKPKIEIIGGLVEKPGAIKLIPPKKIQTLVETNIFSDALSASIEPKKIKRKRPVLVSPSKDGPISPDTTKLTPLKFYQDTLDESKNEEKSNEKGDSGKEYDNVEDPENQNPDEDDDLPLKKVKEDIDKKVKKEKSLVVNTENDDENVVEAEEIKKPGPGCGPDGPPGVLMLHRRKGPKKKLSWQTDDKLTQIRYFEIDLSERVNVSKQSFLEMKNMERFGERDALNIARRGFDDTMEPQIEWRPLIEVDNVTPHPNGCNSKQRAEQAAREMTTLRALYFSNQLIPDNPAEAEIEPHFAHDIPIIPLEDLTGNPDAINDFTSTQWPEPKGLAPSNDLLMGTFNEVVDLLPASVSVPIDQNINSFRPFGNNFDINNSKARHVQQPVPLNLQQNNVQSPGMWGNQGGPGPMMVPPGPMIGNNNPFGNPNMELNTMTGNMNSGPSQNGPFMNGPFSSGPQFNMNTVGSFGPGPQNFNNINFGPMGQGPPMMNNINGGPNALIGQRNNRANMNNGGNWRSGGNNFQDNTGPGNWRSAGSGPNNRSGGNGTNNAGICKAFKRGNCRLGKSCKYVHPSKKRM